MPLVTNSTYRCPWLLSNGHLQTLWPSLARRVRVVAYRRERIETPDGDFLDLDWAKNGSQRVAVLAHGLEGDSKRHYMLGMANALVKRGWDAVAWNARGCSGEPNRVLRFTHSGATEDLQTVISHVTSTCDYSKISLIGFSLGGNLTLKYLGERGQELDPRIKAAVAFSVPCDLQSSSIQLAKPLNWIYMQPFLGDIQVPTLLVNARNDPFLADPCYPIEEAQANASLHLEMPVTGGHVGFGGFNSGGEYWSETRAVPFLD